MTAKNDKLKMEQSTVTFKVEQKTKDEFEKIAKGIDLTPSQLLRDFMRAFVGKHNAKGKK